MFDVVAGFRIGFGCDEKCSVYACYRFMWVKLFDEFLAVEVVISVMNFGRVAGFNR